jgi:hypothetical protein
MQRPSSRDWRSLPLRGALMCQIIVYCRVSL